MQFKIINSGNFDYVEDFPVFAADCCTVDLSYNVIKVLSVLCRYKHGLFLARSIML